MDAGAVGVFRRKEMALKIEGTIEVDGKTYEAFDFRQAQPCELYTDGTIRVADRQTLYSYPILREVKPPAPKYRPFANAEEFKPHRDRWLRRNGNSGCFRTTAYNDKHHWCDTDRDTWDDVLKDFVFDDDGSPCGVLITE